MSPNVGVNRTDLHGLLGPTGGVALGRFRDGVDSGSQSATFAETGHRAFSVPGFQEVPRCSAAFSLGIWRQGAPILPAATALTGHPAQRGTG